MRALWLVCLFAAGCFSVHEPPCSYACGPSGACPSDYQCLADGYCHKSGNTESCGYPDLSTTDLTTFD